MGTTRDRRTPPTVTWVLAGALRHTDDAGHAGQARPGVVHRTSAGGVVRHAEHAGPDGAHYVQMWLRPASPGGRPAYDTVPVDLSAGLARVTPLRPRRCAGWSAPQARWPPRALTERASSCGPARAYHMVMTAGTSWRHSSLTTAPAAKMETTVRRLAATTAWMICSSIGRVAEDDQYRSGHGR